MASRKFQRKIEAVAAQVMEDGEQFVARVGAYLTGDMFNALGILTDHNVYLLSTPPLKAFEVRDVVLKSPIGSTAVAWVGRSRLEIGDFYLTCTPRMAGDAQRFAELASQPAG